MFNQSHYIAFPIVMEQIWADFGPFGNAEKKDYENCYESYEDDW